jgi:Zn-dependent protease/predicted transcriptional regulator
MKDAFNLGKVFGIQLRLHYSWFIIFGLLAFALVAPHWSSGFWWAIGIITCLLFFASVIAHELAHSLVGRANGIPVRSITLFIFGGIAQMTKEAASPNAELKMAVAGPACSAVIGGMCFLIWSFNSGMAAPVASMVWWLMFMNLALATFNMIPGFPLDGGRVLRSVLWRSSGDYKRSTRIATRVGEGVGYTFIAGGIVVVFLQPFGLSWFSGLWIAFIGWFLKNAASTSYRQTQWRQTLKRFTAAQVMTVNCPVVPADVNLNQVVQEYIIPSGCRLFMVADMGRLEGILSLQNIKPVSQPNWGVTQVKEIMTPIDKLKVVEPGQDALSVLEQMDESETNQILVSGEGGVTGVIARDDLIAFLRTRAELGI